MLREYRRKRTACYPGKAVCEKAFINGNFGYFNERGFPKTRKLGKISDNFKSDY